VHWFYEGYLANLADLAHLAHLAHLADLWLKPSPVAQQAFGRETRLAEFRRETLRRLGAETRVLSEGVMPAGEMQVYQRTAEFQRTR
jgi:hypothetical protein